jgi:hypothetical protein
MVVDYQRAMNGEIAPKAGDVYNWAGGTLTRNADGTLTYQNSSNSSIKQVLSSEADLKILANKDPAVRDTWVQQYGVDALLDQNAYRSNGEALNKMLSSSGTPNSSTQIAGSKYSLNYDQNGTAKSVTVDGKTISINEFLNSPEVSVALGVKDDGGATSYIPSGKSNDVPSNFNGEVAISTDLKDILKGTASVAGGPFDSAYNGVSGSSPSSDPLSGAEYELSNLTLASSVWGITEIGEKMCKPAGKEFATSLVNWWVVLKNYVEAEKIRNKIHAERIEAVKSSLTTSSAVTVGPTVGPATQNNNSIQLQALKSQIELYNVEIDSISGSSLYSGDSKAQASRATSRLAWREAVLAAVYQGIVDSIKEDQKVLKAYAGCLSGVDESMAIATKACEQSTKDCDRKKMEKKEDGTEEEVADPVPGSCEEKVVACEMQNQNLPLFRKVSLNDLSELYNGAPIPSKVVNEKLFRVLKFINLQVNVFFPKSVTPSYGDWLPPLNKCTGPLEKVVKDYGVLCPSTASDKDYDKEKFEGIGQSDDVIASFNHYTVGEKNSPSSVSYANTNQVYKDSLDIYSKNNTNNLNQEQLQNEALRNTWVNWINGPYSKNYLADKPINDGLDPEKEMAYAKKVYEDNKLTSMDCNDSNCKPNVEIKPMLDVKLESPVKITESAKNFLSAMGIANATSDKSVQFLEKNWNTIDLYFGQSNMRRIYFSYHQDLVNSLIESDRYRLAELLVSRQKLVDAYHKLEAALNKLASGNTGTGAPGVKNPGVTGDIASGGNGTTKAAVGVAGVLEILGDGKGTTTSDGLRANTNTNASKFENQGASSKASIFVSSNGLLLQTNDNVKSGVSNKLANKSDNPFNKTTSSFSTGVNAKINKLAKSKMTNFNSMDKMLSNKGSNYNEGKQRDSYREKMDQAVGGLSADEAMTFAGKFNFGSSSGSTNRDGLYAAINGKSQYSGSSRYQSGDGYRSGSGTLKSGSAGKGYSGASTSETAVTAAVAPTAEAKDATISPDKKKLLDAINAKKFDRNKFEKKDGDSIFDQITKAYVRNYEKVND